jgi:hypothetical protein
MLELGRFVRLRKHFFWGYVAWLSTNGHISNTPFLSNLLFLRTQVLSTSAMSGYQ